MRVSFGKLMVFLFVCAGGICSARADLRSRIDGIIDQPLKQKVRFGIQVTEADSGRVLYERNTATAMIPASNMKLIVTAAALEYLGANYQYETKAGLCENTLVVIGSGDPLLGDLKTDVKYGREPGWIFEDIVNKLKSRGVSVVNDIVVDSTFFDDERVHPNWPKEELNRWYAAEVSGLNYNNNCIDITVRNIGGRAAVSIYPQTKYVQIYNEIRSISHGSDAVGAYRKQGVNELVLRGTCKDKEGPFSVAIERPAAFFGYLLAEHLLEAGIETKGKLIEKEFSENGGFELLGVYRTSIEDCLLRSNKNSLGLAAEALLKTIDAEQNPEGKGGSWKGGREEISNYLTGIGVNKDEFFIDDGSGLSRGNLLSPGSIVKVLMHVREGESWHLFKHSLAAGGVDGTIGHRFAAERYRGKILAKTGTITGVKALSGVCVIAGDEYIFSVLANGPNGWSLRSVYNIARAIIDECSRGR